MKARILRFIPIIIILALILSMASFAAETSSAYISSTSAYFVRSGNDVNIYFSIVGRHIMNEIGVSEIRLFEKNGNTWSKVYTFDATDPDYTADMLSYNTSAKADHVTYAGSSTSDYMAVVYFYAADNYGSDTITYYTYS